MKNTLTSTLFICLTLLGFGQFGLYYITKSLIGNFFPIRFKNDQTQLWVPYRLTRAFNQDSDFITQLAVTKPIHTKNHAWSEPRTGNEPPKIDIDILQGNKTFFFPNRPIQYAVRVVDVEDGSLADGRISPDRVTVYMDYFSRSFDSTTTLSRTQVTAESPMYATAQKLIIESDCRACHTINKPSVGPMYIRIAQKYKGIPDAVDRLARKVITGGRGVWGEATMSPHSQLSVNDASTIVTYILSLSEARGPATTLPISGVYTPVVPEAEKGEGYFRLLASYTDRGTQSTGPIKSEQVKFFRSPILLPQQATWRNRVEPATSQNHFFSVIGPSSYLGYAQVDMTDISQLAVKAIAPTNEIALEGTIEIRLGSPTGKLIGSTSFHTSKLPPSVDSIRAESRDILIDLMPTIGTNDVYFLVKNPQASPRQLLIQIDALVFKPVTSGSASR